MSKSADGDISRGTRSAGACFWEPPSLLSVLDNCVCPLLSPSLADPGGRKFAGDTCRGRDDRDCPVRDIDPSIEVRVDLRLLEDHSRWLVAGESVVILQAPLETLGIPTALLLESGEIPPALFILRPGGEGPGREDWNSGSPLTRRSSRNTPGDWRHHINWPPVRRGTSVSSRGSNATAGGSTGPAWFSPKQVVWKRGCRERRMAPRQ